MSIVEEYRDQFLIYFYDEDIARTDKLAASLKGSGFKVTGFNSRGLFLETLKIELPHIIFLFYQPMNLKFRETLKNIREISDEIEVVILGSSEFWPGIHSLIRSGEANDYWNWPVPGKEVLQLRFDRAFEKHIYKFIAEQRSEKTKVLVERVEKFYADKEAEQSEKQSQRHSNGDSLDVTSLVTQKHATESELLEDFVNRLKTTLQSGEFIFFKNYPSKNQLLVTRTSFASENYFRGQSVHFDEGHFRSDRESALNQLRDKIQETFSCDEFVMQPVEFADEFYGLIMAVNSSEVTYLKKAAHYLGLAVRNIRLEHGGSAPDHERLIENDVRPGQFLLSVSTEVSRARRLKLPVSLLVAQIEYVGEDSSEVDKAYKMIQQGLRDYDLISRLSANQIAIVLPHCSYEDAAIKAETVRRQLIARGLKTQNAPLRLCFGVSEYPRLSMDSDSLLTDAKKACSQVMVSGKNKVCLYTAPKDFEVEFTPSL